MLFAKHHEQINSSSFGPYIISEQEQAPTCETSIQEDFVDFVECFNRLSDDFLQSKNPSIDIFKRDVLLILQSKNFPQEFSSFLTNVFFDIGAMSADNFDEITEKLCHKMIEFNEVVLSKYNIFVNGVWNVSAKYPRLKIPRFYVYNVLHREVSSGKNPIPVRHLLLHQLSDNSDLLDREREDGIIKSGGYYELYTGSRWYMYYVLREKVDVLNRLYYKSCEEWSPVQTDIVRRLSVSIDKQEEQILMLTERLGLKEMHLFFLKLFEYTKKARENDGIQQKDRNKIADLITYFSLDFLIEKHLFIHCGSVSKTYGKSRNFSILLFPYEVLGLGAQKGFEVDRVKKVYCKQIPSFDYKNPNEISYAITTGRGDLILLENYDLQIWEESRIKDCLIPNSRGVCALYYGVSNENGLRVQPYLTTLESIANKILRGEFERIAASNLVLFLDEMRVIHELYHLQIMESGYLKERFGEDYDRFGFYNEFGAMLYTLILAPFKQYQILKLAEKYLHCANTKGEELDQNMLAAKKLLSEISKWILCEEMRLDSFDDQVDRILKFVGDTKNEETFCRSMIRIYEQEKCDGENVFGVFFLGDILSNYLQAKRNNLLDPTGPLLYRGNFITKVLQGRISLRRTPLGVVLKKREVGFKNLNQAC